MKAIENVAILHEKVTVDGLCAPAFTAVRDTFRHLLDTSQDIGASVAVFVDGAPVVDLWGGHFDDTFTRPWERDTIAQGYSSTKTVAALCALVLADRGELDLDAPIAKYWPEFAAKGKGGILVKQILGHTAMLCGWDTPMTFLDLYDLQKSTALLANQAPMWSNPLTSGYHGYTQGHLIGEVVRRITGMSLGTFLAREIAGPLGVGEDYYIGTPAAADRRVSALIPGARNDHANGNRLHDLALHNPHPTPMHTRALDWRRAELPAMNGHGNARGLATLQSLLACGGANGVRMLSDRGRERVLEPLSDGPDLVIGVPCKWGMGFSLETSYMPGAPTNGRAAWWGGNGGSMSYIDLDAGMALGYVPNRWISGPHETDRARQLIGAVYQSLASGAAGRAA